MRFNTIFPAMSALFCLAASPVVAAPTGDEALQAAIDAGRWIESHTIETEHGVTWPADPEESGSVNDSLYSGAPGVVLFFVELWRATDEDRWLDLATQGADNLIANLPQDLETGGAGLYSGIAGVGFALEHIHDATRVARYRRAAEQCLDLILEHAQDDDHGVTWGPVTDIISGDAGTGLFLLWAHKAFERDDALQYATNAGRSLLARADDTDSGLSWRMAPDYERIMPNFSHGTAGVAFFLARLAEATGDPAFLDGAQRGAAHVRALAGDTGEAFQVHHHHPGGEDLYYMGWCHGPVGTSRLFTAMARVDESPEWEALERACARAVEASGAPIERSPGFWENVGRCCGSAGVGDFYLDLYSAGGDPKDLRRAALAVQDVLQRASSGENGVKWVQAEHRTRPEFLVAQTGLAQGASGVGLMLLRYHTARSGRPWTLFLPDEVR